MIAIELPVKCGFIITIEIFLKHNRLGGKFTGSLMDKIMEAITEIETLLCNKFANVNDLLLVSVHSKAVFSRPGMMNKILNLGLNDEICDVLSHCLCPLISKLQCT